MYASLFFFFFLFLSGWAFRFPREAAFGVGWALAVEIWYFFVCYWGLSLGGYGTCN